MLQIFTNASFQLSLMGILQEHDLIIWASDEVDSTGVLCKNSNWMKEVQSSLLEVIICQASWVLQAVFRIIFL